MYVKRLIIENVRGFRGRHEMVLVPGVNFFVGDNNSGKSTVFEALLFLFGGLKSGMEEFKNMASEEPTRVEALIAGDVEALVAQDQFKELRPYVYSEEGCEVLKLERSDEERTVEQRGKLKSLSVKTACFWHPERNQFENPVGIDAKVKTIFDFEAVWADAQPNDHLTFGNTKTLGRILDSLFQKLSETEQWRVLEKAHADAFADQGDGSFRSEILRLESDLKALVDEQYGQADYRFDFRLPESTDFMKKGELLVDDGSGETGVDAKGTGMQRAIALGLIQLYARTSSSDSAASERPLVLMLDEPDTWLHPKAQLRLGDALDRIGVSEQVFIITHSPYLIRKFKPSNHLLTIVSADGDRPRFFQSTEFGLAGDGEPSWGEINYRAFDICSSDFHNELFGLLQTHLDRGMGENKVASLRAVNSFLLDQGLKNEERWIHTNGSEAMYTLPVYVRNAIHHPENGSNPTVTEDQLRKSTRDLLRVVQTLDPSPLA